VDVGSLVSVQGLTTGSRLTLRLTAGEIGHIPADVQARVLPNTLFGDEYVDLALPSGASVTGRLAANAVVAADTSAPTVALYQAYTELHTLLGAVQPAKLQVALTALADALHGRGAQLGQLIANADTLLRTAAPSLAALGNDLHSVADISTALASSAPDLLSSLDDAVALSGTVVDKQNQLAELLVGGSELADQTGQLVLANSNQMIQLVHATGPIATLLAGNTGAPTAILNGTNNFLDAANRAFHTGRFVISAAATLNDAYPYTAADCPRYPGLAGPNCGAAPPPTHQTPPAPGGSSGSVGSPQEQQTLHQLVPLLPTNPGQQLNQVGQGLLDLLLGPLLRGSQVTVP
jgi:virulence factor Mce-like protein